MTRDLGPLAGAVVRVRAVDGAIAGAGFLVAPDLVCTCAHVVTRALGGDTRPGDPPTGLVPLDFPLLTNPDADGDAVAAGDGGSDGDGRGRGGDGARLWASVVGWRPVLPDDTGDLALLRLREAAPAGARVPWLVEATELWDHRVRVFGFPARREHGVWATGRLRAVQGAGWIQMEAVDGPRVEHGFSGAPVWDADLEGVVGMTVAADIGAAATTAYLHPVGSILRAWPELLAHAMPSCPYRGLDSFGEDDEEVFHGRDAEVTRLQALVRHRPVAVLAGPSGCGKSSLARAGLAPRLRREGWRIVEFRPIPGLSAPQILADVLVPLLEGDLDEAGVVERLVDGRTREVAARLARRHPRGLLLFADQFEEVTAADPGAGRRLLALISELTDDGGAARIPVRALLTMRSGSMDALLSARTEDLLRGGVELLAPMGREQLRSAITGPLAAIPQVSFEPGLVERLLDDAGAEPGSLPLVEFTLTRLWDRRRGGRLCHEAYEAFGGVAGALADYAEEVFHGHLRPVEQEAARRLFVRLARPAEGGDFTRCPARVRDLPEEQRRLVARLADRALLVTSRTADGSEIVDVAHEALLRRWDRLRRWLAADRDFRTWQEALRQNLRQWERTGRTGGALLRGPLLGEAVRWSLERPQDISPDEHAYIAAGRVRHSRELRRLRLAVALITALAVTATALAGVAYIRNREVSNHLRAQAARLLAQEAQRRANASPSAAALMALAAWRTDGRQPEAYGALLALHARLRGADLVRPLGGEGAAGEVGTLHTLTATPDGRTAAVVDDRGVVSVVTDLLGEPQVRRLPRTRGNTYREPVVRISPDGRRIGMLDARLGLTVWSVDDPDRPLVLHPPLNQLAGQEMHELAFSPDGRRLLAVFTTGEEAEATDRVRVWDLTSGEEQRHGVSLPSGQPVHEARFTPSGNAVLLYQERPTRGSGTSPRGFPRFVSVDVRSGARRGVIALGTRGEVVLGGSAVALCNDEEELEVLDTRNGAPRMTVPVERFRCSSLYVDATGRYAYAAEGDRERDGVPVSVVDLRDGAVARTVAPRHDVNTRTFAVLPRRDGRLAVLAVKGGELLRFAMPRPGRSPAPDPMVSGIPVATGQDGRYQLLSPSAGKGIRLLDRRTGREHRPAKTALRRLLDGVSAGNGSVAFTADSRHLVSLHQRRLTFYSVPELALEHDVELPTPTGVDPGSVEDGWVSAAEDGSVPVVYAGSVSSWDPATGRPLHPPVELWADRRHSVSLSQAPAQVFPRPRHPGHVIVRGPEGAFELWDLRERRRLGSFPGDAAAFNEGRPLVFDSSGNRLAVLRDIENGGHARVDVWDVPGRRLERPPLSAPTAGDLIGFSGEGHLVTHTDFSGQDPDAVQLWDVDTSVQVAELLLPATTYAVRGDTLADIGTGATSLSLDPSALARALCRAVDRPFTPEERRLLPAGTVDEGLCP